MTVAVAVTMAAGPMTRLRDLPHWSNATPMERVALRVLVVLRPVLYVGFLLVPNARKKS